MLQLSISIAYTVTNALLAGIIFYRSPKNMLTHFYTFCVGCLVSLGVVAYLLHENMAPWLHVILEPMGIFLYSLFPFFFLHFMVLFVRRYEILKSKSIIIVIYLAGLFSYTMVLLGYIQGPIDAVGTVSQTGYIFYLTWMSIFFAIGIAMLYSLVEGFSEKGLKSNLLLTSFALLLLVLPGPFTESVFFNIFKRNIEFYFLSSTAALVIVVYLVFRHKIIMNTPYDALRTALNVINDIIIKTNENFRIEMVRGAVASQFGYTEKDLLGRSLVDLMVQKEYFDAYRTYVHTGKMREAFFDVEIIRKTGERVPMNFSFTPVFANEDLAGYVGVGRNITERRRAELLQDTVFRITRAENTTQRLTDLYKAVHGIIADAMPAHNFFVALRDERDAAISHHYYADQHAKDQPQQKGDTVLTDLVLRTGKSMLFNEAVRAELCRSNGIVLEGPMPVAWLGVPLTVEKKTFGVIAVQDYEDAFAYGEHEQHLLEYVSSQLAKVIQRKRSEEEIRKQAALIDIAPNAIIVCDLAGRIFFWSKGAESMYGWHADEVMGKGMAEIMFDGHDSTTAEAFRTVSERGTWMKELDQKARDGSTLTVESLWTLVHQESDEIATVLIVNTNVTEKKRLESQFFRAQRMESIGTLAGGIAHDLNNVLSPILIAIHGLKRRYTAEEDQRRLTTLEASAKRGAAIVKQVLMFARGAQGERILLQPKHLIREMERIADEAFPKTITIRSDIARDLKTIIGDSTQIHQVLLNLFVNARDAMPDGGTLTINAQNVNLDGDFIRQHVDAKPGEHIMIAVSDTGVGIPAHIMEKIFEPFFTTKGVGVGTGLGLSTASAIMKGHQGVITVESEVGKGTTFRIYFPVGDTGEKVRAEEEKLVLLPSHGELILLVDDEFSIREMAKEAMQNHGYRVKTAGNGEEAVQIFRQYGHGIAAVVTDIMMPMMDGRTMIQALRKLNAEVKIIATSGLSTDDTITEILRAGVQFHIPKPYTAEKLLYCLQKTLQEEYQSAFLKN